MHQNLIIDVFDSLQNFILLKQQSLIIYFWMTFKKNHKKNSLNNSKVSSKNYSFKSISQDRPYVSHDILSPQFNTNIITKNLKPKMSDRPKRFTTQYVSHQQDNNYHKFEKPQNSLKPLWQKQSQYNVKQPRSNIYHTNHIQQLQLDNSDEFQDIVLDRLSKLQSNINKLMRSRKTIENNNNYKYYQKYDDVNKNYLYPRDNMDHRDQINHRDHNDYIDRRDNIRQTREEDGYNKDMRERKKKFFDSLHNIGPQAINNNDIIYNLKYIPTKNNNTTKNNTKSRRIPIQTMQNEDILQDIQYFNETNLRNHDKINVKKQKQYYDIDKPQIQNNSNPSNKTQLDQNNSKNKGTSTLYINRYKMPQTTKNNRIHYMPNDIQMQTVVQYRRKYNRKKNNNDRSRVLSKNNNVSQDGQEDDREEHQSLSNNAEYHPNRKNNNLTSFY